MLWLEASTGDFGDSRSRGCETTKLAVDVRIRVGGTSWGEQ